jgi:phosphoribosyl-AMP cyclohydrolase
LGALTVSEAETTAPDFSGHGGLLPVIAQEAETGEVLMLAYMNAEAYQQTVRGGHAVYYSRSRNRLWTKGEESGHFQTVEEILVDCDGDTILLKVRQVGAACHRGYRTCFFRRVGPQGLELVQDRVIDPEVVYKEDQPDVRRSPSERPES